MDDGKVGIFPTRMQPLHNCHLETICNIAKVRPVIVVMGSTQFFYRFHDPFTAKERFDMAGETLADAGVVRIVPLPDFFNGPKWTAAILEGAELTAAQALVYSRNDWTLQVCREREEKIATEIHPVINGLNGTAIRNRMVSGRDWKPFVPRKVADWLTNRALQVKSDPRFPGAEELDGLSGEERIRALYLMEKRRDAFAGK